MKRFIHWIKWSFYRIQVANELHRNLRDTWHWIQCWSYAGGFKSQYDVFVEIGDKPDAKEDVEEEMHCWSE